jgi:hypothetical protein
MPQAEFLQSVDLLGVTENLSYLGRSAGSQMTQRYEVTHGMIPQK